MKNSLKKLISRSGFEVRRISNKQRGRPVDADDFFELFFSSVDPAEFIFLQVGAHDGKTIDPIYPFVTKYGLSGVAVEPVPEAFALLKETYRSYPKVRLANVAIAHQSRMLPMYTVDVSRRPLADRLDLSSLASLDKKTLEKTLRAQNSMADVRDVGVYISEQFVRALTFSDFAEEFGVRRIDMLQIDCEGYDAEILSMVDFSRFRPSLVNFESVLLSEPDRAAAVAKLENLGYRIFQHGRDTCAYRSVRE